MRPVESFGLKYESACAVDICRTSDHANTYPSREKCISNMGSEPACFSISFKCDAYFFKLTPKSLDEIPLVLVQHSWPQFFSSSARARSAFAARSFASPSSSLERFDNSPWIKWPIPKNAVSIATPIAIMPFPSTEPHVSHRESYAGWQKATISSPTTPATTRPANTISSVTQVPVDVSKYSLFALLTLLPMFRSGKSNPIKPALLGIFIGALMWAVLFFAISLTK